jgi:phytanoyl-CoA hydroxylase
MAILQQPDFVLGKKVTPEQLQFFHKYGVLQFRHFISRETVAVFLNEVNKVQKEFLDKQMTKINGIPLKFGTDVNGEKIIQRLAFTSHFSPILSDFLKDERLAALTELLQPYEGRIGENEKDGLVVNHYINTAESEYKQLGWHTDSPRDIFLGSRIMPMLNVGLHLDDCPFENGGLRVLAGTHNQGIFTLLFKKKYFVDNRPDPKEIGLNIEAGDLTVHDGRLWHRVQKSPNTGEKSRRRVMYIPIVTGSYQPKNDKSPTPFYHRIAKFVLRKSKENMRDAP